MFANEIEELEALLLENASREKTVEQKVREAEYWKKIEAEKSAERQKLLAGSRPNTKDDLVPNLAQGKGKTIEKVSERVGMAKTTYSKAAKVVETADQLAQTGKQSEADALLKVLNTQSVDAAAQVLKMPEGDRYRLALQSNDAAETVVPSTLVTYAEFVWQRAKQYTLQEVADMLGWSEAKTKQYSALSAINPEAWRIVVTTFDDACNSSEIDAVTDRVTSVTFTEGLLRAILGLELEQQLELVQSLARGDIQKGRFKSQAENYRARNEMKAYALTRLGDLGEPFTSQLLKEIYSGAYDTDWKNENHPKLHKLIASMRDEWERKNSIHLVHGDFYEEVKKIGDGSIDLVLHFASHKAGDMLSTMPRCTVQAVLSHITHCCRVAIDVLKVGASQVCS